MRRCQSQSSRFRLCHKGMEVRGARGGKKAVAQDPESLAITKPAFEARLPSFANRKFNSSQLALLVVGDGQRTAWRSKRIREPKTKEKDRLYAVKAALKVLEVSFDLIQNLYKCLWKDNIGRLKVK